MGCFCENEKHTCGLTEIFYCTPSNAFDLVQSLNPSKIQCYMKKMVLQIFYIIFKNSKKIFNF